MGWRQGADGDAFVGSGGEGGRAVARVGWWLRWKGGGTKAPLVRVHQGRWVMGAAGIVGWGDACGLLSGYSSRENRDAL